jgi:Protein of unknown function (DUF4238)
MMLRNFANDDGKLWFWRREFDKGDVRISSTQNLFVEKDLYTVVQEDGSKDVDLETFLAKLEGDGARFIAYVSDVVRNNALPALDDSAWKFWHHFLYFHLKRTPGFIAGMANPMNWPETINDTVEQIKATRISVGQYTNEPGLEKRISKNVVVMAQSKPPNPKVIAAFDQLGLVIYRIIDPKKSFIVGDVPGAAAQFRLPNNEMSRPTMFLPLAWDISIGQSTERRKVEVVDVDRDQVRRMNEASTGRSTIIAGRSEALIKSLSCGVIYEGMLPVVDQIDS